MNYFSATATSFLLRKTKGFTGKFKTRLISLITIILFGMPVSAQDITPPVLINAAITCSSLNRLHAEGCFSEALHFDGNRLNADVAALYTDPSQPVTADLQSRTADPGNSYCSWSFIYTYRIQDGVGNYIFCDVIYSGSDNIKPTFTVPADITLYQTAHCELENPGPAITGDVTDAFDNCGVWQITYVDCGDRKGTGINAGAGSCTGTCPGQKIIERKWFVRDSCGNEESKVQKIFITDTIKPEFTVFPQDFTTDECGSLIYDVQAFDNCSGIAGLTYEFTGATTGTGIGSGSGTTFNYGVTQVTITATDCVSNMRQRSFAITVTCNKNIEMSVSAGITRTIYTGVAGSAGPFGPQSINLCSNVTGGTPGYTYSWSPAAGLNNTHIANPVASPAATTTYLLKITDHAGGTRNISITINVLQLSSVVCGGNGNNVKFNVCHIPPGNPSNAHNICVSQNALIAHLISGSNGHNNCYLGPCGQQLCFSTNPGACPGGCQAPSNSSKGNTGNSDDEEIPDAFHISVSPNPSGADFLIQVFSRSNEPVRVRILDNNGVVRAVGSLVSKSNYLVAGRDLVSGIYIAEVIQGNNRKALKLVKLN